MIAASTETAAPDAPAPSDRLRHLPPLLILAAATGLLFWPIIATIDDEIACACHDGASHMWLWWHTTDAVRHFRSPWATTTGMFWPAGVNLAFNQVMLPVALVAWPVAEAFGYGTAANVMNVEAAFLTAVATYFIALRAGADRFPAAFAGMAVAFAPYRFFHASDHLDIVHTEFTLFGILAFLRLLEAPSRRRGVVFGLVAGVTFLANGYFFLLLALAVAVLWFTNDRDIRLLARPALRAGAVVTLLVSLPLGLAQIDALRDGEVQEIDPVPAAAAWSVDLTSWVVPPPTTAIGVDLSPERVGFGEGLAYAGLVVLALAALGWRWGDRRQARRWLLVSLAAGIVAMGPALRVAGWSGSRFDVDGFDFSIPLPGLLLSNIPLVGGFRAVGRFAILAQLGLAVVAALGLTALCKRFPARAASVTALAFVVLFVEFRPDGYAKVPAAIPEPYAVLASHDDERAVLDLPIVWSTGSDAIGPVGFGLKETMFPYYATEHRHPIVAGTVGRFDDDRLAELRAIPVYRQLLAASGDDEFDDPLAFDGDDLRALGIGYVVYHRDIPRPPVLTYLEGLDLLVLADDGTVVIFEVPS